MQLQYLALLLSAGSLALPTENAPDQKAPGALTERSGHVPWAAAFAPDDSNCTKAYVNNKRPKVTGSCVKLEVGADDWFGINWGAFPFGTTGSFIGYSDANCYNKIGEIFETNFNNTNKHGVNTCVKASWYGGHFGSISQHGGGNGINGE